MVERVVDIDKAPSSILGARTPPLHIVFAVSYEDVIPVMVSRFVLSARKQQGGAPQNLAGFVGLR